MNLLKLILASVSSGTKSHHEIIVIDGGSSDGTIDYLQSRRDLTSVYQGKLLGLARSYNQVWKKVRSKYSCWLSDDTEIVFGSLDEAVAILEKDSSIGMVGLKMKDTIGPWKNRPYMGAISEFGILNCNHGVIRTKLAKQLGYFNEEYMSYLVDPDLTASVLSAGYKVVLLKNIAILHHREWAKGRADVPATASMTEKLYGKKDYSLIYFRKFKFLGTRSKVFTYFSFLIEILFRFIIKVSYKIGFTRWNILFQDLLNIFKGRFIRKTDYFYSWSLSYHLVQEIPKGLLLKKTNPYREINSRLYNFKEVTYEKD